MSFFRRVSWTAIVALLFVVAGVVAVLADRDGAGIALAVMSVTWALLSLKEVPT